MERRCKPAFYCEESVQRCRPWPISLWRSCSGNDDCDAGQECNCKVGGVQVCEIEGKEALSVYDELLQSSDELNRCMSQNRCWRGQSAYPPDLLSEHSCSWHHCRRHMSTAMFARYCGQHSLPTFRQCIMPGYCEQLQLEMAIDKAPLPQPPPDLVARLHPLTIALIVVVSFFVTLLAFCAGFFIGWVRRKYASPGTGATASLDSNGIEFTRLDSSRLVSPSMEL